MHKFPGSLKTDENLTTNVLLFINLFVFLFPVTIYNLWSYRCFVGQNKYGTARDYLQGVSQGLTHLE